MNKTLSDFARAELKAGLAQCTESQQETFKQMYSHDNLDLSIDQVVDKMPDSKLDWAMQQVQRTLSNNKKV